MILNRGFVFADGVHEVTAVLGSGLVDHGSRRAPAWNSASWVVRSVGITCLKPMARSSRSQPSFTSIRYRHSVFT